VLGAHAASPVEDEDRRSDGPPEPRRERVTGAQGSRRGHELGASVQRLTDASPCQRGARGHEEDLGVGRGGHGGAWIVGRLAPGRPIAERLLLGMIDEHDEADRPGSRFVEA
jgi:hypothetical protein